MDNSPRKVQETVGSPRSKELAKPSPRSLHTFGPSTSKPCHAPKIDTKVIELEAKMEVMELPSKLGLASDSLKMLKSSTSGNRVRNGAGGDSSTRLLIEGLSKEEINKEMKEGLGFYKDALDEDKVDNEEEDEDQVYSEENTITTVMGPDRARFNVWKGTNYDLHVLGDFKSDLERNVKSFKRPDTKTITMDPFCREDSGLKDEPSRGDAFIVWKTDKTLDQWRHHFSNTSLQEIPSQGNLLVVEDEEKGETYSSDSDSLPDEEMTEYLRSQMEKLQNSENITGETLYYDEEFQVIRNMHKSSHSLTNYGTLPDETWIGKGHLFYPEMTLEEKMSKQQVAQQVFLINIPF